MTIMDPHRQQYVPAAPPQSLSQAGPQGHLMRIPPPPPPRMTQTSNNNVFIPPPPGPPPPSTAHGAQGPWQRQSAMAQPYPPPPPPMPGSNHPQYPHLAYTAQYGRNPGPLSIPPPPNEPPPLTFSTYIPDGGTFGPGVGIPALYNDEPENDGPHNSDNQDPVKKQSYVDGLNQQTQSHNPNAVSSAHESIPGNPPAALQHSLGQDQSQTPYHTVGADSHYHLPGVAQANNPSPHDIGDSWPLEHVLRWLAQCGFSNEWQEAFKALDIKGASFIGLGRKGSLGKIYQVIYPQLSKECNKSGTTYNQAHEREEGMRLVRLTRALAEEGQHSESVVLLPNESTDDILSTHRNSANAEHSPGLQFSTPSSHSPAPKQTSALPGTSAPGSATYENPSDESGRAQSSRSETTRNMLHLVGERRRHSPSASSDTNIPPLHDNSGPKSHSGSPALHHAAVGPADSLSAADEIHNNRYSSDSTMMNRGHSSQGFYGGQASNNRSATSGSPANLSSDNRLPDSRRSTLDQGVPKEQNKGLLHRFRKWKGYDSMHQFPDEANIESPTSPGGGSAMRVPLSGKAGSSGSDMSPADRPSSMSDHERFQQCHARKPVASPQPKRYVFVTPDGWNYRLVDVTDVDAADQLRAVLCSSVGIRDAGRAQIYSTTPGQMSHEEPLSDTMLVVNRRSKSDSHGTLKFLIHSIPTSGDADVSHSSGLGLTIPGKPPHNNRREKNRMEAYNGYRMSQAAHPLGSASSSTSRHSGLYVPYAPERRPDSSLDHASPVEGDADNPALASQTEHQRVAERKNQVYQQSKQEQIQQKEGSRNPAYGIKRDGVIDFDSPRVSPFDEKKSDNLVPFRKPPLAPSESNTLTKVNSLSKKTGERGSASPDAQIEDQKGERSGPQMEDRHRVSFFQNPKSASPTATHSLGAALANVGKMSGAIGKPFASSDGQPRSSATSPGIGRSNRHRRETSAQSLSGFYENSAPSRPRSIKSHEENSFATSSSRPMSSTGADNQSAASKNDDAAQSEKQHGPDFDFKEAEVSFVKSPLPSQDADEDSDEGLFAKPLANKPNTCQPRNKPAGQVDKSKEPATRPTLTVNTTPREAKVRSVSFKSPSTTGDSSSGPSNQSASTDKSDPRGGGHSGDSELPSASSRHYRRDSFARDDIWASRPPVEGMIDHLEDFFPNIDLDEPYVEAIAQSPSASPSTTPVRDEPVPEVPSLRGRAAQKTESTEDLDSQTNSDTLGSDESTLKPNNTGGGVARVPRRNAPRSNGGGLNRMKSIREVARGAQQVRRKQSGVSTNAKAETPLRRKSTKMFGAKIMQISPQPGSRLSDLDPLPQHHSAPREKLPQRQPTFRIIRGQLIGKGTYGKVYLGINADNGEILAVKHVAVGPKVTGNDKDRVKEVVGAIDQEIDTMQHLEHPNIVQYLGCERAETSISIYLEYIPGGSVGSCLRKHGKFEEGVVKSLNHQVLSGLAYLHDRGILHRDLKADNILLDLDGTCKISDFGISKKTDNIYGNDVTNSMQGSVFWMAPEVVKSQGQGYSAKVDIWSLGCVVLEMFAGRRPWSTEEAIGAIYKLGSLSQAPPIPEDVSVNISPAALAFMYDCFTV